MSSCGIGSAEWIQQHGKPDYNSIRFYYMKAQTIDSTVITNLMSRGGSNSDLLDKYLNYIVVNEAFNRVVSELPNGAEQTLKLRFGINKTWYEISHVVGKSRMQCERYWKSNIKTVIASVIMIICDDVTPS